MRRVFGIILAVLALGSTYGFGLVLYQTLSGDFVGGEVAIVWTITAVVGVVTVGLWAATVGLLSQEKNRKRWFTYLGGAAVIALVLGVGIGVTSDSGEASTPGTTAPTSDSD